MFNLPPMEYKSIKLASGLFESERQIAGLTAQGYEVIGFQHHDPVDGSGPETWVSFERPRMAA